jgi:hypothetical protein
MYKLSSIVLIVLWLLLTASQPGFPAEGAKEHPQETDEGEESYPDPNTIPYRSRKNLLVHLFELPSEVWRLVWTPLGATVIWIEHNRIQEKAIDFFLNDARTGGIFPIVSIGGNTGFGVGVMAFHNNLFNKQKRIQFNGIYSSDDNNSAALAYSDSSLFDSAFYLDFTTDYFNDFDENYYKGGNDSDADTAETSYAIREGGALVNVGYALHRRIGFGFTGGIKSVRTRDGQGRGGDQFLSSGAIGIGTTSLISVGSTVTLDFRKGWPRTNSGSLLRFTFQHNREIDGSRFEYNRYTLEGQQFVPIPFLARNRRLALRGLIEKTDRLNGKQVPFYELSVLGDAADLRGYDQARFRQRGLLLFNLEYRYPVWDTWDAVIFVDEGQVFDGYEEIAFDRFHFAAGTGLRFMSPTGFAMRLEVGFSREKVRALFQITPNY